MNIDPVRHAKDMEVSPEVIYTLLDAVRTK